MMRKTVIAAGAIAAALMAYQPAPAVADAVIQFVFPGGSVGIGDGHSDRRHRASRVSCRDARHIVRDNGFHNVDTVDCDGDSYRFHARRHGDKWRINLDAWSGRITSVRRRH